MANQQITAFQQLRALLPAVFQGPGFNAVIDAIGVGDQFNQNNANAVFQNSLYSNKYYVTIQTYIR